MPEQAFRQYLKNKISVKFLSFERQDNVRLNNSDEIWIETLG